MVVITWVIFACLSISLSQQADLKTRENLFEHLKTGYHRVVHPDNLTLEIGMSYLCGQYDDESHMTTSRVYERYSWIDSRLKWNPEEYGGLQKVTIPDDLIWKPDIKLFNSVDDSEERDHATAVVLSSGTVYWIVPATYETLCSQDDDNEDTAHCKFSLGPWAYDSKTLPMKLFEGGFDTKLFLDACPYKVSKSHAYIKDTKYDCCEELYSSLEVRFCLTKSSKIKSAKNDHHRKVGHHNNKPVVHHKCIWPEC